MSNEIRKQSYEAADKAERLATELSPDTSLPLPIEEPETNLGDPASYETALAQGNETARVEAIPPSTPGVLSAGNQFGAYQIVSLLGAGGMGEVYLARDSRLSRPVALKTLPARLNSLLNLATNQSG